MQQRAAKRGSRSRGVEQFTEGRVHIERGHPQARVARHERRPALPHRRGESDAQHWLRAFPPPRLGLEVGPVVQPVVGDDEQDCAVRIGRLEDVLEEGRQRRVEDRRNSEGVLV